MMYSWDEKTPPVNTTVMASYSVMDKPSLVNTCRRGCCVSDPFVGLAMMLPRYWREPTQEEYDQLARELALQKQHQQADSSTRIDRLLYEEEDE